MVSEFRFDIAVFYFCSLLSRRAVTVSSTIKNTIRLKLAHLCFEPLNVSVSRAASTTGILIKRKTTDNRKCFLNVARKRRRLVG